MLFKRAYLLFQHTKDVLFFVHVSSVVSIQNSAVSVLFAPLKVICVFS